MNILDGMISVEEYYERFPGRDDYLNSLKRNLYELIGFIKWNDECACCWGGPWDGNYVLAEITDGRVYATLEHNKLYTKEEYIKMAREFQPTGDIIVENVTVENPIQLYLCGNDDTSYSKFFETVEEAKDVLATLLANPTWDHMFDLEFVFTN